jgi:hypothetical protein
MSQACDIACQRNKQLSTLLKTYQDATVNKNRDPEAYEKARIQYFTVKEGRGWLQTEKKKIAQRKVIPILDSYQKRYDAATAKAQAAQEPANYPVGDDDEIRFVTSMIQKEKDKAGVYQRLSQFNDPVVINNTDWLQVVIDTLIGIVALIDIYLVYRSGLFGRIGTYFSPPVVPTTI